MPTPLKTEKYFMCSYCVLDYFWPFSLKMNILEGGPRGPPHCRAWVYILEAIFLTEVDAGYLHLAGSAGWTSLPGLTGRINLPGSWDVICSISIYLQRIKQFLIKYDKTMYIFSIFSYYKVERVTSVHHVITMVEAECLVLHKSN